MDNLVNDLFKFQDIKYRSFQMKLIPNLSDDKVIGIRTPMLRSYAKKLIKSNCYSSFIENLPHNFFDENQLHAFIISELSSYDECISLINKFLPYIDNWATCDQLSPRVFKKHSHELLGQIKIWISSKKTYTVRFGIGMLMKYYLDDTFNPEHLQWVIDIKSEEYYVKMMIAWYFATALAKQYEYAIKVIENHHLDIWIHNKAIQKALESSRVLPERKKYLKSLKKMQ